VERLWYTCPDYICFFKSSGLSVLLLEPTLSLVQVVLLHSRVSLVQVAVADLVLNPDSDIGLGEGCLTSSKPFGSHILDIIIVSKAQQFQKVTVYPPPTSTEVLDTLLWQHKQRSVLSIQSMHSVYISADCLSSLEFSSRAASLGGGRVSRNGRCVFQDFLFTIVATRFVSQL